ncbi:threonine synthase, partial [Halorubrum saccharovorum]
MESTETTTAFRGLESRASGRVHETADPTTVSAEEQARGLDPAYDYDAVDPETLLGSPRDGPAGTGRGHWRFDALLPFPAREAISAGEGATPLVPTERLADELDVDAVYVKDEGRNPTGTVLDRGLSLRSPRSRARAAEGA